MDDLANKNIKITRNISSINNKRNYSTFLNINRNRDKFIEPISKDSLPSNSKLISTMDVETIIIKDTHVPIAISIAFNQNQKKLFLIDYDLLKQNPENAVIKI